jgi:CRISPR-associated protein Csb2
MKALPQGECPEWLSGHQADGRPSLQAHVAFLPLPFVDAKYADGHVLGLAMAVPRAVPVNEARRALGPLLFHPSSGEDREIQLWRNGAWRWQLRRETRDWPQLTLRAETWTEASCVWASVTPVVLHHYPKRNRQRDLERILYEAFASAGLPHPRSMRVGPASAFEGAPDIRSMPEFTEGGMNPCRYHTHVTVTFDHCVQGPIVVGRGRFRGYGLFRPVRPSMEHQ